MMLNQRLVLRCVWGGSVAGFDSEILEAVFSKLARLFFSLMGQR